VVAAATELLTGGFRGSIPDRYIRFFFYKTSRSALGSSVWVPSDSLLVGKAAAVRTTALHLVSGLRMSGTYL
jgi:hypothetical protein